MMNKIINTIAVIIVAAALFLSVFCACSSEPITSDEYKVGALHFELIDADWDGDIYMCKETGVLYLFHCSRRIDGGAVQINKADGTPMTLDEYYELRNGGGM